MAERYQNRHFPAGNDYDRDGGSNASARPEGDPLAELARLIGQTDPFAGMGRANLPLQPHARPVDRSPSYDSYDAPAEPDEEPAPAPPSWIQRAVRQEAPPPPPQDDYPSAVHPLHRYAAAHPPADDNYDPDHLFADSPHEPDLSRYDDALYGGLKSDQQNPQYAQAYGEDDYAYDEEHHLEPEQEPRRRGGMITVIAVLALAVFGVGGAFAYRTFTGSVRRGEPPIIRADAGPTKIIPAPTDGGTKVPDRMATGDGTEKIVPREETPVDLNARNGAPRVVFPPLNQNGNPPAVASVAPNAPPPANVANGTLPNNEPHKIKTLSVRGDAADAGAPAAAALAAKPAHAAATPAQRTSAAAANSAAASANAPLSLAPQAAAPAEPPVRVASTNPNPVQTAPSASGSYLVQISSQRSETDAQASFKALQGKFPSVLGSRAPVIRRADLGAKGIDYWAMVGPFNSYEEASQFCGSLKSAGGQCVAQRN